MKKHKKEYYGDVRYEDGVADSYALGALEYFKVVNKNKKSSANDIIYAPYILAENIKTIVCNKRKEKTINTELLKAINKVYSKNKKKKV